MRRRGAERRGRAWAGRRAGVTIVELLVAAVLSGVVSTAAVVVMVRMRRAAAVAADRAAVRNQLAQAAGVLAHELRAAALVAGAGDDGADLLEASDSVIDLRAVVGGAVACAVETAAGGGSVVEAGVGVGLGWWSVPPRAGDLALVNDAGAPGGADTWHARPIASVEGGGCAVGTFAALVTPLAPRFRLLLAPPALPAAVSAGAPVRVLRRRRYTLYRGGDGLWAMGMREWDAAGAAGVQPVAGPFEPPDAGGLHLVVRDSSGAAVAAADPGAALVEVQLVAVRRRAGLTVRDSARVVVRPAGAGWAP